VSSGVLTSTTSGPPAATPDAAPYLSRKGRAITPPATVSIGKQASRRAAGIN
jgi:hypothetical protein